MGQACAVKAESERWPPLVTGQCMLNVGDVIKSIGRGVEPTLSIDEHLGSLPVST